MSQEFLNPTEICRNLRRSARPEAAMPPRRQENVMSKIEYRVRPVTRYIVTRYTEDGADCASEVCGEFDNETGAVTVASALANATTGAEFVGRG